jgi:hypothetical protein
VAHLTDARETLICQLKLDEICDMATFDARALKDIRMECLHHALLLLIRRIMLVEGEFEARGETADFEWLKGQIKSMLKHEKYFSRADT